MSIEMRMYFHDNFVLSSEKHVRIIFDPKHTLWVLVRTASVRRYQGGTEAVLNCTHNVYFEQKY